jgi:hypothetical protein
MAQEITEPEVNLDIAIPKEVYDSIDDESFEMEGVEPSEEAEPTKELDGEPSDGDKSETTTEAQKEPESSEADEPSDGQSDDAEAEEEEIQIEDIGDIELADDEELVWEDEDGNETPLEAIVDDWNNDREWKKSNTEKAQSVAEEKTAFADMVSRLSGDKVKEALADEDFMEAVDDYYEGKDKNPLRHVEELETYTVEEQNLLDEKVRLEVEKDIFSLQKTDKSLEKDDNIQELIDYASENGLRLPEANKLMNYDKISEELKTRTKELRSAKKSPKKQVEASEAKGKGIKTEGYEKEARDWDEARSRASKSWDSLMNTN